MLILSSIVIYRDIDYIFIIGLFLDKRNKLFEIQPNKFNSIIYARR